VCKGSEDSEQIIRYLGSTWIWRLSFTSRTL
jgi:hypothetical protein